MAAGGGSTIIRAVSTLAPLFTALTLIAAQVAPAGSDPLATSTASPAVEAAPVVSAPPVVQPQPQAQPTGEAAVVRGSIEPAPPSTLREAPATPLERRELAARHAREGRHFEAALEYEGLWRELHEPADLVGAATEREVLGHRAHAAAYVRELVVRGAVGPDFSARLMSLEQGLVPVKVRVRTPEPSGEVAVRARPRTIFASDARPELVVQTPEERSDGHEVTLMLDPGMWDVSVDDPAYEQSREEVRVVAGQASSLDMPLRGRAHPPLIGAQRLRVGPTNIVLLGVGFGLLIGGQVQYGSTLNRTDAACMGGVPECRELLSRAVTLRSAGTGLLGAGLGGVASNLGELARRSRTRQAIWIAEASVGVVGIVAGALGVGFSARAFNGIDAGDAWLDASYREPARRAAGQHSAAAFFLGMGTGLFVQSLAHLFQEYRLTNRARVSRKEQRGRVISSAGGVTLRF